MKKRIFIPYCMYGNGHRAIAKYIESYFMSQDEELEILTMDLLRYSMPIAGKFTQKVCNYLMLKHPYLWSFVYDFSDTKLTGSVSNKINIQLFNNKKIKKIITDFNPNLTISTHFYGSSLIDLYNQKGITNSKLVTVVTDYEAHEMWLRGYKREQAIVVGDKDEVKYLKKRGVKPEIIKPYGIPINPIVQENFNREKMMKKLKIVGNRPICLFFGGGGNGSKASLPYIKTLIKEDLNIDILYIAGKNMKAKNRVEEWIKEYGVTNVKTFGYVDNVPELLQICDFVISKPGGAQSTECLYFKKPMIMIRCSGGQERANYKFFEKNNYGKLFKSVRLFRHYMKKMEKNYSVLESMQKSMQKSDSAEAMKKLYDLAMGLLK